MESDLATVLREIVEGMKNPSLPEVAEIAQELLAHQVKQSWDERVTPDREMWPALHGESFAGLSRKSGRRSARAHLDMAAAHDISEGTVSEKGFETRGQLPQYWSFQDDGTLSTGWGGGIEPREFWGLGDDLLNLVADILAQKAAKAMTGG
jgi:hypothetical protein